jgi:uncharacterized phage-associated protein
MVSVFDVAQYIIDKLGQITSIKLQKLVYYCQAWSLVWDDSPLFEDKIEAWANGPVVLELYKTFQNYYYVPTDIKIGDITKLSETQKETIEAVLRGLGDKSSGWLIELTHSEDPWIKARKRANVKPGYVCSEVITFVDMAEYYSSLVD